MIETDLHNADSIMTPSHDVQNRLSPERVVSDIPLVISPIQPTKEMAARETISKELGERDTSMKRKRPPKRSNYGVKSTARAMQGSH